jgi:glycosyltransferase involved in cell wall biosynthesis
MASSDPLISILMPVKNTGQYLRACLDSVISQTETNWELIVVDDHSTDNSYKLMREYAKSNNKILIFRNKGNGIINALKTAFEKSNGALITRMDSDDSMAPEKLVELKNVLLKNGVGTVATGLVEYFAENGLGEGYQNYQNWLNSLTENETNFNDRYKECAIASPCWMVYKSDLKACNSFNETTYPEDYDLFFRFYANGLQVKSSKKVLHHWRDYPERTSRNHEHYQDNRFLDLKLNYFLQLDHQPSNPLVLWGAGKKGKQIAKKLTEKGINFHWVCDNENKIGKDIYGKKMKHFKTVEALNAPQIIVAVANADDQKFIIDFAHTLHLQLNEHYFLFC